MIASNTYLKSLLSKLQKLREEAGITQSQLENKLNLGPGWITRFESGETIPDFGMFLTLLSEIGSSLEDLLSDLSPQEKLMKIERSIYAEQRGKDLLIHFHYANYDAVYNLSNATIQEFDEVIKTLRDGLARLISVDESQTEAIKTDSVAKTFLTAVKKWPHANPSDLWWFVIYRAYADPFNHPAQYARLDFTQSWKRTGGWALEEVLVRHYGPHLKKHGINIFIAPTELKERIFRDVKIGDRIEVDKVDVILTGQDDKAERFLGVIHVKASFAERRTDDVPMSKALIDARYVSPLWTMDCKSTPSETPFNKGELGSSLGGKSDNRSAKRKDIEDDGYFSACFSYNSNTIPTPKSQKCKAKIHVCDFKNPDDVFSQFIISTWQKFRLSK